MSDDQTLRFHYTNDDGLLGILRNLELWATDAAFLNDALELRYAAQLLTDQLRSRRDELEDGLVVLDQVTTSKPHVHDVIQALEDRPYGAAPYGPDSVYVSCFCDEPDLLSQWRAYGRRAGYAIGMRLDRLPESRVDGSDHYPVCKRVAYGGEPEAARKLSEVIDRIMGLGPIGIGWRCWGQVRAAAIPTLATIKHHSFHQEQETRLIAHQSDIRAEAVAFRRGRLGVTPYVKLKFPRDALASIWVGPGPETQLRLGATQNLCSSLGLLHVEVRVSDSPFAEGRA